MAEKLNEDVKHLHAALLRVLEMVFLTIDDTKNGGRLKELCRFKEAVADWYCGTEQYNINPEVLKRYSLQFALLSGRKPQG